MSERVYYRIDLRLRSALSIGAADSVRTDNDVVLDSRGLPLIPATSLAGVLRSYFDEKRAIEYFGEVIEKELERVLGSNDDRLAESAVRIYDATFIEGGNNTITVRDSVALQDKVAKDGLKFDRQIVESGALFRTLIEIADTERCRQQDIERAIGSLHAGELHLGSKTTRGFGEVEIIACKRAVFGLSNLRRNGWIDFDPFLDDCWDKAEDITHEIRSSQPSNGIELRLGLRLKGGVSIREYSAEPGSPDEPQPDYSQMIMHGISDTHGRDVPVIPGTTWAGAFRDRFRSLSDEYVTQDLFGTAGENAYGLGAMRSSITFSESVIKNGQWVQYTRNAIDRFTGGTIDGTLYTERTYYHGTTELVIRVNETKKICSRACEALIYTLADLHNGFLSVGGLASVGRGLFQIESATLIVNGISQPEFAIELLKPASCTTEGYIAPNVMAIAKMLSGKDSDTA